MTRYETEDLKAMLDWMVEHGYATDRDQTVAVSIVVAKTALEGQFVVIRKQEPGEVVL